MDTISMGIRISSCEISGGHKDWDHSRKKRDVAHPPPGAVVTHTPLHPHLLHHLAAIPHIPSLWVSQVQVSVSSTLYSACSVFPSPLLRPRGPTRKCLCVHFCKFPSVSLSGPSFLGPCWNRVDGNEMGKFWHHWLTCCCCSLLLVQTDWSEIPPDWQVFPLRGILVIFQDIHKLGIPKFIVSFLQLPTCSSHHSLSVTLTLQVPSGENYAAHSQLPTSWPTGNPCIINTLNNWLAEILVCICPPLWILDNWQTGHIDTE